MKVPITLTFFGKVLILNKFMFKNKKIIAIIPARGGSKGVPRKNIKILAGKPLIAYSIELAKQVKYLDKIVVSTEDKEIAEISKKYGAEVTIRPKKLAGGKILIIDVLRHIIKKLTSQGENFEYIVLLEPTSPLRNVGDVNKVIKKAIKNNCDSVSTIILVEHNPYKMFKLNGDKIKPAFGSKYLFVGRQSLPKIYRLNGAVYIFKTKVLLRSDNFFGKDARAIIMPEERSADINNELDFIIAESIIKKNKNNELSEAI